MSSRPPSPFATTQQVSSGGNVLPDEFGETIAAPSNAMPESAMATRLTLEPGTRIKHYELIRQLGAGGMGMVFLARDVRLARRVAIKFLLDHRGPAAERFLTEARMTAQCRHENIVVIHDVDEIDGRPYMVLEYVEGRTLRDAMTESHPAAAAIELMLPVVKALISAHGMGIVHRDLKPENILLADSGQVKVLDFGIAKQVSTGFARTLPAESTSLTADMHHTQSGSLVGTMPYMSPEQWLALPIDERTDIWAAGVILFELATGAHPLAPLAVGKFASVAELDLPMPSAREKLPLSPEFAEIIDRCLRKRREERLGSAKALMEALERLGADRRSTSVLAEGTNPFTGLSAFQESDAARFFGRDDDVTAVVGRLRQQQLLTIVGASGAGKSSFVRAGVIPALKRGGRDVETFILRPGRRPIAALADVLAFLSDTSGSAEEANPAALAKTLRTEPGYLGARLRARCRKRGANHRALLFVDQLEELYTQGIDLAEQAAFCACIEGVADDASSPLRVIMTIRADYLDRASEDRAFSTAMTRGLFVLPAMTQLGLRAALERPLAAVGYRFEDETLCNEMLGALEGTKNPLPVLQFTANQLWEARDREGKRLTRAAYEALGGVVGALSTHADAVVSGMSPSEQRMAKAILMQLVSPERTRAVVRLDELFALSDDRQRLDHVVRLLADARLLSIEAGSEREGKTVELTHESLIQRWSKLRQWLDENEKDAVFVAELRSAAAQWEKNDRAEGLLWRDRAADQAGQWLERNKEKAGVEGSLGISKRELSYLETVARLSQRTKWRRRQALGAAFAFLSLIALVVSVLGLKARKEARRADAKAEEAEKSAEEAHKRAKEARNASRMASVREHLSDPTLVLSLLRELESADSLPPRWSELARWATFQRVAKVVLNHQHRVSSASFSPDGARIVIASWDKTARVWNADGTGVPIVLKGHQDVINSASFSPDGTRIVTASADKTARVWNADGKGVPIVLKGHQGSVNFASFSPDGARIVTASGDKTARVWNADGRGMPIRLEGHQNIVSSASFSPNGARIVTASWDKTARVWNADGRGVPIVLEGHLDLVNFASFSSDGTRIVTASSDKTARVWNADGKGVPILLQGHQDIVNSASFSPDGARIVTASFDKTARVWNADGKGVPIVLLGHQDRVFSASFSPDGARIVTASFDKTVRVWNADGQGVPLILEGHTAAVGAGSPGGAGAFSPDGARIVTISDDTTLRVWSADGRGEPAILRMPDVDAWSAAFSPDGKHIVTSSHSRGDPATGKVTHWATVWPTFEPLKSPNDAELWLATRFCPPVDLRMELLGSSKEEAAEQLKACQDRVDAALQHESGRR